MRAASRSCVAQDNRHHATIKVPIIIITIIIAPAATGSSFGHKLARLRQQHSGFPGRAGDQITRKTDRRWGLALDRAAARPLERQLVRQFYTRTGQHAAIPIGLVNGAHDLFQHPATADEILDHWCDPFCVSAAWCIHTLNGRVLTPRSGRQTAEIVCMCLNMD